MIRIWADFNGIDGDRLALDVKGSIADIRRQGVVFREGLRIIVYDDGYQAEAIVERVEGEWFARVIPGTGRAVDSKPPPLDE